MQTHQTTNEMLAAVLEKHITIFTMIDMHLERLYKCTPMGHPDNTCLDALRQMIFDTDTATRQLRDDLSAQDERNASEEDDTEIERILFDLFYDGCRVGEGPEHFGGQAAKDERLAESSRGIIARVHRLGDLLGVRTPGRG